MPNRVQPGEGEFRIVVIGREGHGKSTVCNALMGKEHFTVGSKTTSAEMGECSKKGLKIKVVDTPDISDNGMKRKEKQAEIKRWKEFVAPDPTIFLLVIKAEGTYTEQDFIAYRQVRRLWGRRGAVRSRLVVMFTFAEGQDVNEVGDRMEDNSPKWIGKVFKQSGGRFIVFKGKSAGDLLEEVMMDDDDDSEDECDHGRRSRSPKGRKGSPKGRKGSRSRSRSPKGSRKGSPRGRKGSRSPSPKGSRKGSPKGRKGSRSRSRSPKGRKGSGKPHHKPKGGRGRRRGHSGKRRGRGKQGGILGILCCLCWQCCDL